MMVGLGWRAEYGQLDVFVEERPMGFPALGGESLALYTGNTAPPAARDRLQRGELRGPRKLCSTGMGHQDVGHSTDQCRSSAAGAWRGHAQLFPQNTNRDTMKEYLAALNAHLGATATQIRFVPPLPGKGIIETQRVARK